MGIKGLLPLLRSITKRKHIRDIANEQNEVKIGIDGLCLLHRCSTYLGSMSTNANDTRYVKYFLALLTILTSNGILKENIIVIFDGCPLPSKADTDLARKNLKEHYRELSEKAIAEGQHEKANSYLKRTISITPDMVRNICIALKQEGIEFIIAAYEADAELAYLSRINMIDAVVTEDSDTLVYGCKRVLFKLDRNGYVDEIKRVDLAMVNEGDVSFANWTDDMFKLFCCLSGNDYIDNLKNVGIKTAYKIVNKYKTIANVVKALRVPGMPLSSLSIDEIKDYLRKLLNAINVYKYQTIFCPLASKMMALNPYEFLIDNNAIGNLNDNVNYVPGARVGVSFQQGIATRMANNDGGVSNRDFLGPILDNHTAIEIAKGNLNPKTLMPFDNPFLHPVLNTTSNDHREDKHGIKRLKAQAVKRDLFSEFDVNDYPNQYLKQPPMSSSSSSSSTFEILPTQPISSSLQPSCKTSPKTTWLHSEKTQSNVNLNGSDLVWSFFDDDRNDNNENLIDNKKKKRKYQLNSIPFEFNTSKVGSSLQTLYRRNKKKFSDTGDDVIDDRDGNEYYRQTVEDWSKREDDDVHDDVHVDVHDDVQDTNCFSEIDDEYIHDNNDNHMPMYHDNSIYINDNDEDIRQQLNKKWMSLGLSIRADECLDNRQFISWNTSDHFTSHQLSSKHSHSDSSRVYSDLSYRKLSNVDDNADDDDVNSMDYWDKTLRV